jgi:hypothetical protein
MRTSTHACEDCGGRAGFEIRHTERDHFVVVSHCRNCNLTQVESSRFFNRHQAEVVLVQKNLYSALRT